MDALVVWVNDPLWGHFLAYRPLAVGLLCTVALVLIQFRRCGAPCSSVATGNLDGVAIALCLVGSRGDLLDGVVALVDTATAYAARKLARRRDKVTNDEGRYRSASSTAGLTWTPHWGIVEARLLLARPSQRRYDRGVRERQATTHNKGKGPFSSKGKTEAVLRPLGGEDLDTLNRDYGCARPG